MYVQRDNPPTVFSPTPAISQVVTVAGGSRLIHLSGQVAWDEHGNPVGIGDHAAQAAQIARNIDAALASVNASRADIVKETIYVVGYRPDLLAKVFTPLREGSSTAPASTLVPVPGLFAPQYLIEVDVVAVLEEPE
jgi:enamine deaminase RidA (YjgF/YER057c/UK114 family)